MDTIAKRKLEDDAVDERELSAKKIKDDTGSMALHGKFRAGLFDASQLEEYRSHYAASQP